MKHSTNSQPFQNDFNYVYQDFSCPIESAEDELAQLLDAHENDSISSPFFYRKDLSEIKIQIPSGWSIQVDDAKKIPSDKVRVTVFHLYEKADIALSLTDQSIILHALHVGGDFMVFNLVQTVNKKYASVFELNGAFGDSPTMILITPGERFKAAAKTFTLEEIPAAAAYLKSLAFGS